jgi:hypothetical protein
LPALQSASRRQLVATRQRYEKLHAPLVNVESTSIRTKISRLIEPMNRSIARAGELVENRQ